MVARAKNGLFGATIQSASSAIMSGDSDAGCFSPRNVGGAILPYIFGSIADIDGSTWDPFAQRLLFTTEGGAAQLQDLTTREGRVGGVLHGRSSGHRGHLSSQAIMRRPP